jgi:non-ribosomal peptide synthetase component F
MSIQVRFWHAALDGLPPELALPADRERPAVPTYRGGMVIRELDANTHASLLALARECRATLYMIAQAAVALLLTRLGAGTDIPIGCMVAGRADEALDELVGFFVNTLVLRTDTSGDPGFHELVARVRDNDLAAFAHQDLPFEKLVEILNPPRSMRHPLFQVMLVLQRADGGLAGLSDLAAQPVVPQLAQAKFDLGFGLEERYAPDGTAAGLRTAVNYSTDLYDRDTAELMADCLVRLFEALADDPSQPLSRIDLPAARQLLDRRHGQPDREIFPGPEFSPAGQLMSAQQQDVAALCALIAELLGLEEVRPQDSFFTLGGHSMLAVRLVRLIAERLGAELPLRVVFERHTPLALAGLLRSAEPPGQAMTGTPDQESTAWRKRQQ